MNPCHTFIYAITVLLALFPASGSIRAAGPSCTGARTDGCPLRVAVKSNMLHDALLTPDLGIELSLRSGWSLAVEGVYAWWGTDRARRCWRIRGFHAEPRYWFGHKSEGRVLSGHHAGVYASYHDYDFSFGDKGWQSRPGAVGVGLSYGYSFPVGKRVNIDVGLKAGYSTGRILRYRQECGTFVCDNRYRNHYFGVTDVEVTLVWFPGRGRANRPGNNNSRLCCGD